MTLSDLQIDYIKELFNVSLGAAAVELSELVNDEVELSVPAFSLLSRQELFSYLNLEPSTQVTAVKVKLDGGLSGDGMLLFPDDISHDLVKVVIGDVVDDVSLTDQETEALTEIASIILDQIITTISSMLSLKVKTHIPTCIRDTLGHIIVEKEGDSQILMFVEMSFTIKQLDLTGDVLFIQDLKKVETFVQRVAEVLSDLGFE